jgi:1-acyl-sn-glycerol-3-phosphate acyltransferase
MTVRHPFRRRLLFSAGKVLQPLLSRTRVNGRENIPKTGPLIIVGNHSAYIEAVLMVMAMPEPIELMASSDIPLRGSFTFLQGWYGFIGINRGEIDRAGLKSTTDLLNAGGRVGIFPEGGVWDRRIGDARLGVAYVSQQTQAPILPMGFGGLIGAIYKITHFQRPILNVNIGKLLPPVPTSDNYRERKALAKEASDRIMESIYALVPASDEISQLADRHEDYEFVVTLTDASGKIVTPPPELTVPYGSDLSYFFHRPVMIGVVIDNMQRPADALRNFGTEHDPAKIASATVEALKVYAGEKPAFLSYRLGNQRAAHVVEALRGLQKVAEWAAEHGAQMLVQPKATFTYADGKVEQLDQPEAAHAR